MSIKTAMIAASGGLTQGSETEKCGSKMGRRSLTPSPTSTAWLQLARKAV